MSRQHSIVAIGEAILSSTPDGESASGLAIDVARAARRLGQRGIPISRLGQDDDAAAIIAALTALDIELDHLQSDPDLPTGRRVVRVIAGTRDERVDDRAAFDQLQWDFDLEDAALRADGVVYGLLARRGGQARSTIDRFLEVATSAVRIADLTNRAADTERSAATRALEWSHGFVTDREGLRLLVRGDRDLDALVARALHDHRQRVAFVRDEDGVVRGYDGDGPAPTVVQTTPRGWSQVTVIAMHALLRGQDVPACMSAIARVTRAARALDDDAIAPELLEG